MAGRRKVLTGRMQRIRVGGTQLSRLGVSMESDEVVDSLKLKMRAPSVEPITSEGEPVSGEHSEGISQEQRALVMRCLGLKGEFSGNALARFLTMDPGTRELRIRNLIDSVWTQGEWKKIIEDGRLKDGTLISRAQLIEKEMHGLFRASRKLAEAFKLRPPTEEERLGALSPAALTQDQKLLIRLLPGKASRSVRSEDIAEFRSWVEGMEKGEAMVLWRKAFAGPLTMASLVHKLRFRQSDALSEDESVVLRSVFGKDAIGKADLSFIKNAFISSFKERTQSDALEAVRAAVWGEGDESLLRAAKASAGYRTLLDFLGISIPRVTARLRPDRGFCMGSKNLEGNHSSNDDAYTSLDINVGGRAMRLHAVFDGVSGHNGGCIASGVAREAMEIAALSGWISSPEDVRMGIILADLAINLEKKAYNHRRMGSTASVSLIEGHDFYGITCGDSPLKVVRGGETIFSSNPHGFGNRLFSGLGIGPCQIDINNSAERSFPPVRLKDGDWSLSMSDGIGDVLCDHELHILLRDQSHPGKAAVSIVALSDSRRGKDKKYELLCTCEPKSGKDDDMSLITDYIKR